jgi:hypothetical protein
MKYFAALILVVIAAAVYMHLKQDQPENNNEVTGLPWQIEQLADGETRVFGITLGRTTLGEAMVQLGNDMELAIIAAPDEDGTLEAYFSHYASGPITGKLMLVMDVTPAALSTMRKRAFQDRGTRRHRLHPDDLTVAYQSPVRAINFMPSYNLDEDIAHARFGKPAEIIQVNEQQKHLLYPDKGLDLILSTEGREILQYLSPGGFSAHRDRIMRDRPD